MGGPAGVGGDRPNAPVDRAGQTPRVERRSNAGQTPVKHSRRQVFREFASVLDAEADLAFASTMVQVGLTALV